LESVLHLLEAGNGRWKAALLCSERKNRILVCVANKRNMVVLVKGSFELGDEKTRTQRDVLDYVLNSQAN
jgi:hypothetical protein